MNLFLRNAFVAALGQFLLLGQGALQAQALGPRPPVVSLPYVNWDDETKSYVPSVDYYGDGWRLHVTHNNDRPIFCDASTLRASISREASGCSNPVRTIGIKIPAIALGTGNDRAFPETNPEPSTQPLGFAELQKEVSTLPPLPNSGKYQYCGPVTLNLDCGFYCSNGEHYPDEWVDNISGGTIERRCERDGNISDIPNTVSCLPGYTLDPATRTACLIQCPADQMRDPETNTCKPRNCLNHKHGEAWDEPLNNGDGTLHFRCNSGNPVVEDVTCLNEGDFDKVGKQCIRKSREVKFLASDSSLSHDCGQQDGSIWKSHPCNREQVMIKTQPLRFSTAGDYFVRTHMTASHLSVNGPKPEDTLIAKVELYSGSRRIAAREVKLYDLKLAHSGSKAVNKVGLNESFPLSDSGLPVQQHNELRVLELATGFSEYIPDLQVFVYFYEGFVGVGQLDLRFVPSYAKPIEPLKGCKDKSAPNYNPFATLDDGSCPTNIPVGKQIALMAYRECLGRMPESNAVYFDTARFGLTSGAEAVYSAICGSHEAQSGGARRAAVVMAYNDCLGRNPDSEGAIQGWTSYAAQAGTQAARKAICTSEEAQNSRAIAVVNAYRHCLGRDPESRAVIDSWSSTAAHNGIDGMRNGICFSAEALGRVPSGL